MSNTKMKKLTFLVIKAKHFVAAVEIVDGLCDMTAPIVRYMQGWKQKTVLEYCKQKGWEVEKFVFDK